MVAFCTLMANGRRSSRAGSLTAEPVSGHSSGARVGQGMAIDSGSSVGSGVGVTVEVCSGVAVGSAVFVAEAVGSGVCVAVGSAGNLALAGRAVLVGV